MRRIVVLAIVVIIATAACSRPATPQTRSVTPLLGTDHLTTSRAELQRTIAKMREKVAKGTHELAAAVTLADALLRQTRVSGNAGLAREAERVLLDVLTRDRD